VSLELKRLAEELRSTWEAELKPRIEGNENGLAETKQAVDRVQDRIDDLEASLQKAAFAPSRKVGESSREVKDMIHYVRTLRVPDGSKLYAASGVRDEPKMDGMEQKVLAIRDESLGGVLAPPDFVAGVVKGIIQFSPIRQIATVRPTSRTSIQYAKRSGNFAAQWASEQSTRTETTGRTYGLDEVGTDELYARVLISNWDLEDPVVDLESIITEDMSEQFAKSEGAAFVTGDGVGGKPEGILTNSDVQNSAVLNGGAAFANADGIIKLAFSVKEQYWQNARFLLNRFSLRDLRVLKDTQGNYLWQPTADGTHGVSTGLPATLYGYPYTIAVDFPTAAANVYTVAFGDFSKAYWVVDRVNLALLRDPFTQASAGAVVLHARKRVGGQVVLPEAINVLKMA
jgi:HK97 family phage major capsid protein